jgi:hypothetical protein
MWHIKASKETHWNSKVNCFRRSWLAPGSIPMSISCFQIWSSFKAWIDSKSLFLIIWTVRDLPRLILIKFGEPHFFIMFDMFRVILKSILRSNQSNILSIGFKIGVWLTSMLLKHELWVRIWFGSIFHVLVRIRASCFIYLRWSLNFLPSVSLGGEVRGECFAPHLCDLLSQSVKGIKPQICAFKVSESRDQSFRKFDPG